MVIDNVKYMLLNIEWFFNNQKSEPLHIEA